MTIILNEVKKIFNIKSVLLLMVITGVMYFLFIEFYITSFPNGRPALDIYNMFVEMQDKYGEFMDEEEFEDFKVRYSEAKEEADRYIQSREDFKKAGITNYDEFVNMDISNKELDKLQDDVIFRKKIDVFWELPWREEYIRVYENRDEIVMREASNEKQEVRVKEILEKDIETSVFNDVVFFNYNILIKYVSITILIGIMFMITPIYLRDNKNKTNYLQYTSKIGRNIFKKKIAAGILSAFIIISLQFIGFFVLYSSNNISMFFNSNISSVFNSIISWYDFTFIQYIILTVVAIYVLGFVVTLMSMLVSSIGQNYITVIGIQLPIALFTFKVLLKYLINYMTSISYPKYFLPISYLVLIFIAIMSMTIRWKRERLLDIAD